MYEPRYKYYLCILYVHTTDFIHKSKITDFYFIFSYFLLLVLLRILCCSAYTYSLTTYIQLSFYRVLQPQYIGNILTDIPFKQILYICVYVFVQTLSSLLSSSPQTLQHVGPIPPYPKKKKKKSDGYLQVQVILLFCSVQSIFIYVQIHM